jgi:hypothetical protein
MKPCSTSWRWQILVVLVLGAGGCGLPEYESRMDKQRERLARFDELNNLLEAPIEAPTMMVAAGKSETQPAWKFDVFLRLPKPYGNAVKDAKAQDRLLPYNKNFPLIRFTSVESAMNIFVVATFMQEKKDEPSNHLYTPATFRAKLREALAEFCFRSNRIDVSFPEKSRFQTHDVPMLSPYPDQASTIHYTKISVGRIAVPYTFDLYLHEESGKQVAIVFQHAVQLPNAEAFNKSVNACLGTLDISAEAAGKRGAFRKR